MIFSSFGNRRNADRMPFAMIAKPLPQPDPDAWRRFERAVDAALHTPPKHREAKPKGESRQPKSLKTRK
jgi:hypothetical protein